MCLYPQKIVRAYGDEIVAKCGNCIECLQEKSEEWAFRIMLEKRHHKEACFVTLTYAETDGNLHKRDLQLFLKRLRKHISPVKIRYFACGEYGSKGRRPHYHLIIFGWKPADGFLWRENRGTRLYRSPTLERLWKAGFSSFGDISFHSAKYCAKYLQKLNDPPGDNIEPFVCMSNRPGIGFDSISPEVAKTDRVYVEGRYIKAPRYWIKVLEREGVDLTDLKRIRRENSERYIPDAVHLRVRKSYFLKKFGRLRRRY